MSLARLEAEALPACSSVSGIVVAAGEDEIAAARRELRRVLEQRRIVALDLVQRRAEARLENASRIGEADQAGDALQPVVAFRQRVGLLVAHHLQRGARRGAGTSRLGELVARLAR